MEKLASELCKIETSDIIACDELDVAYGKFEERVVQSIKICTENSVPNTQNDQPWYDHELKKLNLKRKRFLKILKNHRSPNNKAKYNKIDKEYDKLIFKKKKEYNHRRFERFKNNLKRKWSVINDLLGRKKKQNTFSSIYIEGVQVDDDKKIANGFNSFFTDVPKTYHEKLPPMDDLKRAKECGDFLKVNKNSKFLPKKFIDSLFLSPTSPDEIHELISNFENKLSSGLDGIPPKVVKMLPDSLIDCLTHIFNISLSSGKFVSSFKKSKVVPIHKKK